jgi:hypothetical protein
VKSIEKVKSVEILNSLNVIRHLVLSDPGISVEEITDTLERLDVDPLTRFYIGTVKSHLRDTLRFLRKQGLLVDKQHELPISMGGRSKPLQETQSASHTGESKVAGKSAGLSPRQSVQTVSSVPTCIGMVRRGNET